MNDDVATVSFGKREVRPEEKAPLVAEVFHKVANRYDLMNDAMSLGVHRLWNRWFVNLMPTADGTVLLDVAGGTGDIAMSWLDRMQALHYDGEVTVCDINPSMVQVGRDRALDSGVVGDHMRWTVGDAEALPVPGASVDVYTIAFGIRNVTHIDKALGEARRVLKTGGRFLCLEFSTVNQPLVQEFYDAYSSHVIPPMGQVLAGDAEPYRYLVESIRRFPNQKTFAGMIQEAGFRNVTWRDYSAGVVAVHSGWKY